MRGMYKSDLSCTIGSEDHSLLRCISLPNGQKDGELNQTAHGVFTTTGAVSAVFSDPLPDWTSPDHHWL